MLFAPDFSIITLLSRHMAKVLKHRAWLPNRDGTYRTVEVQGPDSCDAWTIAGGSFHVAC